MTTCYSLFKSARVGLVVQKVQEFIYDLSGYWLGLSTNEGLGTQKFVPDFFFFETINVFLSDNYVIPFRLHDQNTWHLKQNTLSKNSFSHLLKGSTDGGRYLAS